MDDRDWFQLFSQLLPGPGIGTGGSGIAQGGGPPPGVIPQVPRPVQTPTQTPPAPGPDTGPGLLDYLKSQLIQTVTGAPQLPGGGSYPRTDPDMLGTLASFASYIPGRGLWGTLLNDPGTAPYQAERNRQYVAAQRGGPVAPPAVAPAPAPAPTGEPYGPPRNLEFEAARAAKAKARPAAAPKVDRSAPADFALPLDLAGTPLADPMAEVPAVEGAAPPEDFRIGMAPAPPAADEPPTPAAPRGPGFGQQLLQGVLEQLPQILVNYTSAHYDRPDIAEDFLKRRTVALETATRRAQIEAQTVNDERQMLMQLMQLESTRATARRSILEYAGKLQEQVATGKVQDPQVFKRGMQALAVEMAGSGGDPNQFLASHPMPMWDQLNQMRTAAMERLTSTGDIAVLRRASIVDPRYSQPGQPPVMRTPMEVLQMTGDIGPDGTISLPVNVMPVETVTNRDASGKETSKVVTRSQAMGVPQTRYKLPDTQTGRFQMIDKFVDERDGKIHAVGIDTATGKITERVFEGQLGGLSGLITNTQADIARIPRIKVAEAVYAEKFGREGSSTEISAFMNSAEGKKLIDDLLGGK